MLRLERYDPATGRLRSSVTGQPEELARYQQLLGFGPKAGGNPTSRHARWVAAIVERLLALDPSAEHTSRDLQAWTLGRPLAAGNAERHLRLAVDRARAAAYEKAGEHLGGRFQLVGKDGKTTRYAFIRSIRHESEEGGEESKGSS